jgi:hypothetical protein
LVFCECFNVVLSGAIWGFALIFCNNEGIVFKCYKTAHSSSKQ